MFIFYLIAVLLYFVIHSNPVKWIFAIIFPSVSMVAGFQALYVKGYCDVDQNADCSVQIISS